MKIKKKRNTAANTYTHVSVNGKLEVEAWRVSVEIRQYFPVSFTYSSRTVRSCYVKKRCYLLAKLMKWQYCRYKRWNIKTVNFDASEIDGLRHSSCIVTKSDEAFNLLRFDAAVHRVQRIPWTEKGGRVHTSTVSRES